MTKYLSHTLVLVLLSTALAAQNPAGFDDKLDGVYKYTVPTIFPEHLEKEMKKDSNLVILDIRERSEYMVSHLKDAKLLSYKRFNINSVSSIPKDARIVVYCSIGYRSERVGEKLLAAGYKNVFNLYGGIFNWANNQYPIYNATNETTTQVHTFNAEWEKWVNEKTCKRVK